MYVREFSETLSEAVRGLRPEYWATCGTIATDEIAEQFSKVESILNRHYNEEMLLALYEGRHDDEKVPDDLREETIRLRDLVLEKV